MKLRYIVRSFPIFIAALITAVIFAAVTAVLGQYALAVAELAAVAVLAAVTVIYYAALKKKKQDMLRQISQSLNFAEGKRTEDFPLPVLVTDESGRFVWYNHNFDEIVSGDSGLAEIKEVFEKETDMFINSSVTGVNIKCGGKYFTVYSQKSDNGNYVFYFVDNTKLRLVADEFIRTRPAVMLFAIDNMEDVERTYRDSDCAAIRNGVEKLIENWLSDYGCLMTKRGDNSFIIVTKTGDIQQMIDKKFDILDKVRAYAYNDSQLNITLSIGVGMEGGVEVCESQAKQALEMALGRGGDQVAVKVKDSFDFYGGVSKSVERQTKVRTRVVSNAFYDLLMGCDKVIVMGHKYPDLDALGSGLGIVAAARYLGKEAFIATDTKTALSKPLIDYVSQNGFGEYLITEGKAKSIMRKKTLLVVTDTHVNGFVEFPSLLEKASSVMVVDHHRKSVDYIKNAVIFFHDPSASSASELVTQLIEYLPHKIKIGSVAADSLLAGIMLDTKNFVLRSGVTTFETAAYLKSAGADTVRVKRLFADNMDEYKARSEIISNAQEYKKCAVSVCENDMPEIRVVAAQAADELLNIKGIDASFVLFRTGGVINISARSLGNINVQVIMEKLGGGGHQTMAAVQFENSTFREAQSRLIAAVDEALA